MEHGDGMCSRRLGSQAYSEQTLLGAGLDEPMASTTIRFSHPSSAIFENEIYVFIHLDTTSADSRLINVAELMTFVSYRR
jgi:hypothetical protein